MPSYSRKVQNITCTHSTTTAAKYRLLAHAYPASPSPSTSPPSSSHFLVETKTRQTRRDSIASRVANQTKPPFQETQVRGAGPNGPRAANDRAGKHSTLNQVSLARKVHGPRPRG